MYIIIIISTVLLIVLLKRAHTRRTLDRCKPVIAQVILAYLLCECRMSDDTVRWHLIEGMKDIGIYSERIHGLIIKGTLQELPTAKSTFDKLKALGEK